MKRFETRMKLHVLDRRAIHTPWKTIAKEFMEKFGTEPPTMRAMQKWVDTLDRNVLTAEIMKDLDKNMPEFEKTTKIKLMQDLMPVLWNARDQGEDMELAGWKWFLSMVDQNLGREKFSRLLAVYVKEQNIDLGTT